MSAVNSRLSHKVLCVLCRLNKMLQQDTHYTWKGEKKLRVNLIATWPPACWSSKPTTHGLPGGLSASSAGNKWLYCPVPYSAHRGRGALGMTCKPNTSPHSICCLINPINGSFNAPQRQPSRHGRETRRDNDSLAHWKQFWGWVPFPIKV